MLARWHIRLALLPLLLWTCASPAEVPARAAAEDAAPASAESANHSSTLPAYRSTVSEVRVAFFATGENNRPAQNLTPADFAVVDGERVVRSFRSFAHSGEAPLDLVALVDLSESAAPRFRAALNDVLQLLLREQSAPDDHIAVISFGGMRPALLCASGCGDSSSVARLLAVKTGGATPLFDALQLGADFILHHGRTGARPVLILFSDGNDTSSLHSAREALEAVLDAGVPIYSVDMGTSRSASPGSMFLRQVSEATGGLYFSPSSWQRFSRQDGAATVLNAVLDDLRASFVVIYALPSHHAGFHSLRLLPTHNLNLTFRSRKGYFYEPNGH
jgi:VWFA-related protein